MRQTGAEIFGWENKFVSLILRREQRNSRNVKKDFLPANWENFYGVPFFVFLSNCMFDVVLFKKRFIACKGLDNVKLY
jgi:hypothetical protein